MPAGYSRTPLIKKLGIKPGMKLWLINQPVDYVSWLQTKISGRLCRSNETPDWIHLFVKSYNEFDTEMKKIKAVYRKNTSVIIWVSWYKKSSGIPTDVSEDLIRNYAIKNQLVDIRVCAVSDQWSGLKLVVPLKNRK